MTMARTLIPTPSTTSNRSVEGTDRSSSLEEPTRLGDAGMMDAHGAQASCRQFPARYACVLMISVASWVCSARAGDTQADRSGVDRADPAALEFFEKNVRPILATRCQGCHGPAKQKGGLRLDARAAVLAGGAAGPAVVPGDPASSLLVDAINYGETRQMPPKSKL